LIRLKRHKAGARLTLREEDLLHVVIMPPSLNVHTVKVLVSRSGEIEFAEWITGSEGTYLHKEMQLDLARVAELTACLARLDEAERDIGFDQIECDFAEYEGAERTFLRYRATGTERGAFVPDEQFYRDFRINDERKNHFEDAIRAVLSFLPLNWISRPKEM